MFPTVIVSLKTFINHPNQFFNYSLWKGKSHILNWGRGNGHKKPTFPKNLNNLGGSSFFEKIDPRLFKKLLNRVATLLNITEVAALQQVILSF